MIANNASGFNAVKYGETRDHVRQLEVVLPDGEVIQCGRGVVKTSSGYSLKNLFVGSEGTLGVVTEATIGLTGIPERKRAALVTFPSDVAATSTRVYLAKETKGLYVTERLRQARSRKDDGSKTLSGNPSRK